VAPAVPLHIANAPEGGTGKSYLFDLVSVIAMGEVCPAIARSPSPEETEKRLIGAALDGQPLISVDNCRISVPGHRAPAGQAAPAGHQQNAAHS